MIAPRLSSPSRRTFLRLALAFPSLWLARRSRAAGALVGGGCDGCEAIHEGLPAARKWETTLAAADEPGERLEISGVIFRLDGAPAPGVILYCYHTDAQGYYSPAPGATGLTRRHGRLRGWMETNARGEYRFDTIRPAPYPNRDVPAHVHPIVKEPGKNEYYLDDYVFDDDPLLTPEKRAKAENRGGSGILRLQRRDGRWIGRRDIVLGMMIPNYR